MAKLTIKKVELSTSGKNRIDDITKKLSLSIQAMLEEQVPRIKDTVVELAPTAEEEANLISWPGSPWDFFQDESNTLRSAIKSEMYAVTEMNNIISVSLGDTKKINPILKFSWYKSNKNSGSELRSSNDTNAGDAWKHMLEMWEYGGSDPFFVTARDGGMLTLFAPNQNTHGSPRKVESVMKHIPFGGRAYPFAMYKQGGLRFRETLLRQTRTAIKRVQL